METKDLFTLRTFRNTGFTEFCVKRHRQLIYFQTSFFRQSRFHPFFARTDKETMH